MNPAPPRDAAPPDAPAGSPMLRRGSIGLAAGIAASVLLAPAVGTALAVVLGAVLGCAYGLTFRFSPGAGLDALMTSSALGFPSWAAISVVLLPLAAGRPPMWSADELRALVPQLVAWVLFGAALGIVVQALAAGARRWLGPEPMPRRAPEPPPRRVVILGGGFAGVSAALELERLLGSDRSVSVTLVSETNALLFTPMLAEVAGSALEPTHISCPLRTSLRRTAVVRGAVRGVDFERRQVLVAGAQPLELRYDHLVLALGSVTNHFGLEGVARHALGFKSLREATRIRAQVIDAFERAAMASDPRVRRELLTFIVAGGGFAGVELAGAVNDFARGMVADHPALSNDDVSVILAHPGDRILPELSPALARYAQQRLEARGVAFRLGERVADARPGAFVLKSGEELRGHTLVWTAGTAPSPLLRTLGLELSPRGAIVVDRCLAVPGSPGVWAIGDCAAVVDVRTGKPCPPTAQFALREGRCAARGIHAALRRRAPVPFHFEALGTLCVVGYQTACAELRIPFTSRHVRFSGLLAWMMWRFIYLSKLPGPERKARVLADWTFELFFPRDVVQPDGELDAPSATELTPLAATRQEAAGGHP
ncbi:MAG TPA: NAD(P)/FAD-dependent oxidoreductase [Anaeromyxobacter sp.]|nr:NAD(P)/FAD-dependent oxidoreductase [Anaeromyxobacter sp.]